MPILTVEQAADPLLRQVLTSRNVRGGLFVDFVLGGLNTRSSTACSRACRGPISGWRNPWCGVSVRRIRCPTWRRRHSRRTARWSATSVMSGPSSAERGRLPPGDVMPGSRRPDARRLARPSSTGSGRRRAGRWSPASCGVSPGRTDALTNLMIAAWTAEIVRFRGLGGGTQRSLAFDLLYG
jgi:hypothetical protein